MADTHHDDRASSDAYDPSAQPFLPSPGAAASVEERSSPEQREGDRDRDRTQEENGKNDDPETRHLCKRLYVGRLNSSVKDDDLHDLFGKYGRIRYAKVRRWRVVGGVGVKKREK